MSDRDQIQPPSATCAVRQPTTEQERRDLAAYLEAEHLTDVVKFSATDDDDLDEALCAGRFERVVFAGLDALLTGIWNDHAQIDQWLARGVRIDLAAGPAADPAAPQAFVMAAYDSFTKWRRQQRRYQVAAAAVLSVLGLAAMAVLFFLVPVAR